MVNIGIKLCIFWMIGPILLMSAFSLKDIQDSNNYEAKERRTYTLTEMMAKRVRNINTFFITKDKLSQQGISIGNNDLI